MPDDSITVFIRSRLRFKVNEWLQDDPCFKANVTYLDDLMSAMDDEYNGMKTIPVIMEP